MSDNVVNLRLVRKQKKRQQADKDADAARAMHGLTKAEKLKLRKEREIDLRSIEAHRLENRSRHDDD